jgi:hypothetical protein
VPLSVEKFTTIAGIAELPANWRQFLSGAA